MYHLIGMMRLFVNYVLTCTGLKKAAHIVLDHEGFLNKWRSFSSEFIQDWIIFIVMNNDI